MQFIPDALGNYLIPSAVSCICTEDEENFFVGREAKELLACSRGEMVLSFKRFMGTKKTWHLGNSNYTAMNLSAMVLKHIKDCAEAFLGEPIDEAIITVPAYFNDKQRSDTKKAAQIAGLKADRLINEPSAAALAYRMGQGMNQELYVKTASDRDGNSLPDRNEPSEYKNDLPDQSLWSLILAGGRWIYPMWNALTMLSKLLPWRGIMPWAGMISIT